MTDYSIDQRRDMCGHIRFRDGSTGYVFGATLPFAKVEHYRGGTAEYAWSTIEHIRNSGY
jgi:hypothetical protein